MVIKSIDLIKASGFLLSQYSSELNYINEYNRFKSGLTSPENYLIKSSGSFQSFLNDFRVSRNSDVNKRSELAISTYNWINTDDADQVDKFAEFLKQQGLTHHFLAISMASKILFLNNPSTILPYDSKARSALGIKVKRYSEYAEVAQNFATLNKDIFNEHLFKIGEYLNIIEDLFPEIKDKPKIRFNRFIDKYLWVRGS